MKTYYIYHILGIKIGCTEDLEKRMADQGFTEWEILETHTDGWIAGDREIELQKQYGYPVDKVHYMISRRNRPVWSNETRHNLTIEDCKKGGSAGKGIKRSEEACRNISIGKSKLIEDADSIREQFTKWTGSKYKFELLIANQYNVSRSTINRILRNQVY